jgi:ATP synthase protein I
MQNFIMDEQDDKKIAADQTPLGRKVGLSELRKLKARKRAVQNIWSGFTVIGLVGWSVAIPTLLGIIIGVWLDNHYRGERSWTLMLLVIGLALGCLNAWRWIMEENRNMHKEDETDE